MGYVVLSTFHIRESDIKAMSSSRSIAGNTGKLRVAAKAMAPTVMEPVGVEVGAEDPLAKVRWKRAVAAAEFALAAALSAAAPAMDSRVGAVVTGAIRTEKVDTLAVGLGKISLEIGPGPLGVRPFAPVADGIGKHARFFKHGDCFANSSTF